MIWLITRRSYLWLLKLIWRSGAWIGNSYAQFEGKAHYYYARIIAHTDSSCAINEAFNTRWGSLPLRPWSSLSRRNRKYRNTKQTKANRWRHNNPLELSWWSGPVGAYNNPHYSQHYCSSRNGLMAKGTPFSLPYTSIPAVWGNQKTDPAPVILLRGEYPHNSQHYCSFRQGLMAKGTPFSLPYTSIVAVWGNQRTEPDIK